MKKKFIAALLLLFIMFFSFSENFSLNEKYFPDLYSTVDVLEIQNNSIILNFEIPVERKEISYTKNYKDGLLFFKLSEKFPKYFNEVNYYYNQEIETSDELLILAGKELDFEYLDGKEIKTTNRILLFGTTSSFEDDKPFLYEMFKFNEIIRRQYKDCSSYLKEKSKEYIIENLNKFNVDTPWVEGVKGDGIGEGFTIVNNQKISYPYLLIMNGYISYKKPYLYKQNNRIKKIKVTGLKSGNSKIVEVLDTPHPQSVDISFITEPEDIRVEIADVYKGSKYDDTCLHFCITYTNKVIPYEDSIAK